MVMVILVSNVRSLGTIFFLRRISFLRCTLSFIRPPSLKVKECSPPPPPPPTLPSPAGPASVFECQLYPPPPLPFSRFTLSFARPFCEGAAAAAFKPRSLKEAAGAARRWPSCRSMPPLLPFSPSQSHAPTRRRFWTPAAALFCTCTGGTPGHVGRLRA